MTRAPVRDAGHGWVPGAGAELCRISVMDDVPPARRRTREGGRPTIETVARHAGVSRQTVSNALNAPERLAPPTLRRVLDAVAELRYRPNSSARAMRRSAARCVAMRITPVPKGFNGPIFDRFVKELCGEMTRRDHDVRLVTASWGNVEVRAYEDLYYGGNIDGVVLTELHLDDPRPAQLQAIGVPFVAFGRPWGADGSQAYPWVDVDGAGGTEKAVDRCVQRGYRRIAYLGWERGSSVSDDRMAGWRRALDRHGLSAEVAALGEPGTVGSGRRLADRVLDDQADGFTPTALVCVSDAIAVGAMTAARARGLAIGRDVAVVGFDDTPIAAVVDPPLTTLSQPIEECARVAVRLLLDQPADGADVMPSQLLSPTLVVRGTTWPNWVRVINQQSRGIMTPEAEPAARSRRQLSPPVPRQPPDLST